MKYVFDITPEDKATFLELIYAGLKGKEAAAYLDTTGSVFRKFKRVDGVHYDAEFAAAWAEAEASDQHFQNRQQDLREEVDERSKKSDTILQKRMAAELPEYEWMKSNNFRHSHDVMITLAERLPALSGDELKEVRRLIAKGEIEQAELKLLPPASEA